MALFRRRSRPSRSLLLLHSDGRSYERPLGAKALDQLRADLERLAGEAGSLQWESSGQFGTSLLRQVWPDEVPSPHSAFLRKARLGEEGLELVVEWTEHLELEPLASLLAETFDGGGGRREVASPPVQLPAEAVVSLEFPAAVVPEPEPVPVPAPKHEPVPTPEPAPVPAPELTPEPAPEPVPIPAPIPDSPPFPEPEILPPPRSAAKPATSPQEGSRWHQQDDDLFGIAGEVHPDDAVDHGLNIQPEDLPWLNPGDMIMSVRRGPCRIKRVEDEARQLVAQDENKQLVVIAFEEILQEFRFDDGY